METCGTLFWGRSWNASFALAPTATKTANASPAPPSTPASILWNQLGSAARRVQVTRRDAPRHSSARATSIRLILAFLSLESKAEANQTLCYPGDKSKLLVYKVESSLRVDPPNTVRIIAVERPRTSEVEVQVWKSVEGAWSNPLLYYPEVSCFLSALYHRDSLFRTRRCFTVNGNRWRSEKRHRGSSGELHVTHHTGRRSVSRPASVSDGTGFISQAADLWWWFTLFQRCGGNLKREEAWARLPRSAFVRTAFGRWWPSSIPGRQEPVHLNSLFLHLYVDRYCCFSTCSTPPECFKCRFLGPRGLWEFLWWHQIFCLM